MNLRHPYEQLIADKLRQLPAPDADASWQQMKRLLDDNEDRGGGGRKRPPGGNGWWHTGIVVVVLSASCWLFVQKTPAPVSLAKNSPAQPAQAGSNTAANTNNSSTDQTTIIDKTTTLTVPDTHISASRNKTTAAASDGRANAEAPVINTPVATKKTASTIGAEAGFADASPSPATNKLVKGKQSAGSNVSNAVAVITDAPSSNNRKEVYTTAIVSSGRQRHTNQHYGNKQAGNNNIWDDKSLVPADDEYGKATGNNFNPVASQPASSQEKNWFQRLAELKAIVPVPTFNTSLSAGDSIENTRSIGNLLSKETKKLVVKAQRDKAIALLDKQDKKSLHLHLSSLFKPFSMHLDAEPWWAAGIALNDPITVSAQNRYNRNVNAKSGTITDYVPSPYLQFHLNNYVYLQTEINFITPQYTPQLLVYRQTTDLSAAQAGAGTSQQKSIYIQKLYYFNLPVSLHYSPISNLYFSAGLQFSSFQSGLASIEERQYTTVSGPDHASSITNDVLKFKDDSIAAKIAPNEWRWQVGAEYYWNRFSVGLRYNQSLKNAINTTVSATLPPTVNRNQALLFFVRYNLFESRNKNADLKNQ